MLFVDGSVVGLHSDGCEVGNSLLSGFFVVSEAEALAIYGLVCENFAILGVVEQDFIFHNFKFLSLGGVFPLSDNNIS